MQPRVITFQKTFFCRSPASAATGAGTAHSALLSRTVASCCRMRWRASLCAGERPAVPRRSLLLASTRRKNRGSHAYLKKTGYDTILDYCEAMCRLAIRHGILPHTNAGILTYDEMKRLRAVNASMGLMLETTARIPAHNGSKGKEPEVRLAMMEDAGKLKIPFTTGLLLGIGETVADREASLIAIRDIHRKIRAHPGDHPPELLSQERHPNGRVPGSGNAGDL